MTWQTVVSNLGLGVLLGCAPWPTVLYVNVVSSMPLGFYLRVPARWSSTIVFDPPAHIRALALERGYVAPGVTLLKPIAARQGQTVCVAQDTVQIDGQSVAYVQATDRQGRPTPQWTGCHTLTADELFPLATTHPYSFDGRVFGWITHAQVRAYVVPLWTWSGEKGNQQTSSFFETSEHRSCAVSAVDPHATRGQAAVSQTARPYETACFLACLACHIDGNPRKGA